MINDTTTFTAFQVGNLAFSDLCLGLIVLPLSSVYAVAGEWVFPDALCEVFVSADILCSTASIWNLSIVGLDRNKRTACIMILSVWFSSALISLAPLLGWKQVAASHLFLKRKTAITPNLIYENDYMVRQCTFLDLPSYTVYSATGSFFIPTLLMFFVYYKIYQAFAKHRARQIYRQKVIRKHIESTILHEISHVLPAPDVFDKDEEESTSSNRVENGFGTEDVPILEDTDGKSNTTPQEGQAAISNYSVKVIEPAPPTTHCRRDSQALPVTFEFMQERFKVFNQTPSNLKRCISCEKGGDTPLPQIGIKKLRREKSERFVNRKTKYKSPPKPKAISAAKERRGVKVLGIILGCFTVCWTPFFVMYVLVQFCKYCNPNPHIEMFITWLGYSNSAMNPIIYTVFNRDYQVALKMLFATDRKLSSLRAR
ncbi:unnamed protein product [Strongylus vulgaris]|uniref:G-protein coupled receptors family 1 profile domain-containing protein n=1 Tax=Strongylus vulgaris TaxID=40348 RepID=A0A3P7JLW2_STRVU|nr:unnamed protein product [Strongylus vulgaris]